MGNPLILSSLDRKLASSGHTNGACWGKMRCLISKSYQPRIQLFMSSHHVIMYQNILIPNEPSVKRCVA
ncbi:hypothetical protein RJT34_15443 [Clitoria ternatea]|uniref:Uncharacterized protein n=1 Tax=Clitoria ternatea TaxID=43366 RepID=A0AAN9PCN9_CLITE